MDCAPATGARRQPASTSIQDRRQWNRRLRGPADRLGPTTPHRSSCCGPGIMRDAASLASYPRELRPGWISNPGQHDACPPLSLRSRLVVSCRGQGGHVADPACYDGDRVAFAPPASARERDIRASPGKDSAGDRSAGPVRPPAWPLAAQDRSSVRRVLKPAPVNRRVRVQVIERVRVVVRGAVQGVGFRPFVYRLATELGLAGWVLNSAAGVVDRGRGAADGRSSVPRCALDRERPPRAVIQSLECDVARPGRLRPASRSAPATAARPTALVLPDIATCPDCLREIFDPADRRYRYPFTNCTNCGPRFTHHRGAALRPAAHDDGGLRDVRRLPGRVRRTRATAASTRSRTPARPAARASSSGTARAVAWRPRDEALRCGGRAAIRARRHRRGQGAGRVPPGGRRARRRGRPRGCARRKRREEKPFALMFPSLDAVAARLRGVRRRRRGCSPRPRRPSCCSRRRPDAAADVAAAAVAPGNPYLGVDAALHAAAPPAAARAGLPGRGDQRQPLRRADLHRRARGARTARAASRTSSSCTTGPIVAARGRLDRARRARPRAGAAPRARLRAAAGAARAPTAAGVLAVGAHLKNTVALAVGGQRVRQPAHRRPGDAAGVRRRSADVIDALERSLRRHARGAWRCDLHPDYLSTGYARRTRACRVVAGAAPSTPTCWPAWRRTSWTGRCSACRGTAPATALTARSGAANS